LGETYSSLWGADVGSAPSYHGIANLGLNAWLVRLSNGSSVRLVYAGDPWETQAIWIEVDVGGAGLAGLLLAGVILPMRRRARGRAPP